MNLRRADQRAGRRTAAYISGYEGSPLGGYDLALSRQAALLSDLDIVFQPGVNEELAATAVQGTQLASTLDDRRYEGVTGYWYGKSPGVDRASDALRHANLGGTHHQGGALAIVGDDPAAKSSTVPGASELILADLGIPVLYPADPQEALDLGQHAVHLSRVSGLWSALKVVTAVADGSTVVDVGLDRVTPELPELLVDGKPYRHEPTTRLLQPHLTGLERSRNGARLQLATLYARANALNEVSGCHSGARVGIVASGKTWLDLMQALDQLGLDQAELEHRGVRLLHLRMVFPLDGQLVREFAAGLSELVIVEEKRSFLEQAFKNELYGLSGAPVVTGKRDPRGVALLSDAGELGPDDIALALSTRLSDHGDFPSIAEWLRVREQRGRVRAMLPIVANTHRTPYFCSGCPHSRSVRPPEGVSVGGGIGCHALVLSMGAEQVGDVMGLTQMGGEGAQWNGVFPFVDRKHIVQNIGDGTFHHSGSLAVRAAVASGAHITFKLLHNSAVAMTGGQSATGAMPVVEITRALTAEGVAKIIVTTENPGSYRGRGLARGVEVWRQERLIEAQERLADTPGVTVLIHDQECATELRRKRKRGLAPAPEKHVVINERVCEGCGDCGAVSNCLSVRPVPTEFGRKTRIDQASCNADYSCLDGNCPSFMTVVPGTGKSSKKDKVTSGGGGRGARVSTRNSQRAGARTQPELPALPVLPEPVRPPITGSHTTRILGIGGSGVVTLSQLLSTAAVSAGLSVRSLDQTGLAQKGGAVVSDVKVSPDSFDAAGKAADGEVDLYLGADILVAADDAQLKAASPERTTAVVSISEVPTGAMVVDVDTEFPSQERLQGRIAAATRRDEATFLDARRLSTTLFGDDQYAGLLLLGVAYQRGSTPLPAEAIEDAVRTNGVKIEANLSAFRHGRLYVADRADFEARVALRRPTEAGAGQLSARQQAMVDSVGVTAGSELDDLLRSRVAELVAYQDERYAQTYVDFVGRIAAAEAARLGDSTTLTAAVATYLYKLMAYKDEYEVSRLILESGRSAATEAFGDEVKVQYRLHPPVLKSLGMDRKISLGRWAEPGFRALVGMRRLRGTALDPFGRTEVRRTERALVAEYVAVVGRLAEVVDESNLSTVVAIASLPDVVRGYEEVKMANVDRYRARLDQLLTELGRPSVAVLSGSTSTTG
jgi:indolepyruvate ferredoxin oxidoreductase